MQLQSFGLAMQDKTSDEGKDAAVSEAGGAPRRKFEDLPPAAQRALKEAEARRTEYDRAAAALPAEKGGRGGNEPVRYGDYEAKGLAIDF